MIKFFRTHTGFLVPALILILTITAPISANPVFYLTAIGIGLAKLVWESIQKVRAGRWSLDYIAILAMGTSLVSHEYYLAGAIVALMITLSGALEEFGAERAEASLRSLIEGIPKTCLVKKASGFEPTPIQEVREHSIVFVKTNELIPLDGFLATQHATLNQANLTGESMPVELHLNDYIKSGSVNVGAAIEIETTGTFATSSYQKIINLVAESKKHPANLVRVAEKFNWPFTATALVIAAATYIVTRDLSRTLAVLAIATPCPLLIATPIAFLAGMSRAAKQTIIIKKPSVIELLSKTTTVFLDKTGTLTIGEPKLREIALFDKNIDEDHVIVIAAAIEMHSLHPLARALTNERSRRSLPELVAKNVSEKIGQGITGSVDGAIYSLAKSAEAHDGGIALDMFKNKVKLARFIFADEPKENVHAFLSDLTSRYKVAIITGDTEENARRLFGDSKVKIYARATPEHKYDMVKAAREAGERVVMVGDGLNDAPALALADVGIVFSGTENSASIEAASTAILGHDIMLVSETLRLSRRTVNIALQSIVIGIGLSVVGMGFAAFGFITPVLAATIQELIDIGVTINALRASR